jgi:hypothetical protein
MNMTEYYTERRFCAYGSWGSWTACLYVEGLCMWGSRVRDRWVEPTNPSWCGSLASERERCAPRCTVSTQPPYSATTRAFGANEGATTSQWGAAAVRPLLGV